MFGLFRRRSRFGQERRSAVLQVERLEERCTPTTVTNLLDSGAGSLRQEIANTAAGGIVDFAPGLSGAITLIGGPITINKALTIQGPGAGVLTVSGNAAGRIFTVDDGTPAAQPVSISGLTLTDGKATGDGGAILSNEALTLSGMVLTGNLATNRGGALSQATGGPLTIQNSTISGNAANAGGGGVYLENVTATITGSTLSANAAGTYGGGADLVGTGVKTLVGCTIAGNSANVGGGVGVYNAPAGNSLQNCTITGNRATVVSATTGGGGVELYVGSLTLLNCTIAGNAAAGGVGGGVLATNDSGNTKNTTLTLQNSILSGNSDSGGAGEITRKNTPLVTVNASNALIQTAPAAGTINGTSTAVTTGLNPLLGPLQDNGGPTPTLALLPGSPAIDAGSNALAAGLATDQRGFQRFVNNVVDLGAFEFQPAVTITLTSSANPALRGQPITLTATLGSLPPGSNTPAGMVTFQIDGTAAGSVALIGMTATFTTSTLTPSTHSIVATYNTPPFPPSQSAALAQVVSAAGVNRIFAVGAGAGGGPQVVVYSDATGAVLSSFYAFAPTFLGGVRVAVADVNGDGTADVICAAGPGGGPQVEVIDGTRLSQVQSNGQIANSALLASFYAFTPSFLGGVYVAAGVAPSGVAEVVVAAGAGGGPQVLVLDGTRLTLLQTNGQIAPAAALGSFYAFAPTFLGGVRVAVGDINGDGSLDVIAAAGPGGGPQVIVVDGTRLSQVQANGQIANGALLASFYALAPNFLGGVYVAVGATSSSQVNLIVSADAGGGPQVVVLDGTRLTQLQSNGQIAGSAVLSSFYALPASFLGGVRVGFALGFGSGNRPAILTAAGPGGGPAVLAFDGMTAQALSAFFALPVGFEGGLFIAG